MKFALVNPYWTFEGSTYFGCAEPHFPLELLSAREMLRAAGQEVLLIDAWMENLDIDRFARSLDVFDEDFLVIPTAPSYLFWRCPQPELRVPRNWLAAPQPQHPKPSSLAPTAPSPHVQHLKKPAPTSFCAASPTRPCRSSQRIPWEMIAGCVLERSSGHASLRHPAWARPT